MRNVRVVPRIDVPHGKLDRGHLSRSSAMGIDPPSPYMGSMLFVRLSRY
jgi:hypothetical protein